MPPNTRSVPLPATLLEWLRKRANVERVPVSTLFLRVVREELARGRTLVPHAQGDSDFLPVVVSSELLESLAALRIRLGQDGDSDGRLLSRVFQTALRVGADTKLSDTVELVTATSVLLSSSIPVRTGQRDLAKVVDRAASAGGVAMLESATGTGKGLVIAAIAKAAALSGLRVVVAAPSHQINAQSVAELRNRLSYSDQPATIYGRAQFYSPAALRVWIEQSADEAAAELLQFLESDLSRFRRGEREGVFHRERLSDAFPLFPASEVLLSPTDNDEAAELFEEQFERAKAARVVFVSHTMLALDLQARRRETLSEQSVKGLPVGTEAANLAALKPAGLIGDFDVVVVDEGHLFEANIANALSDVVPVHKAMRLVEQHCTAPVAKSIAQVYRALTQLDVGDELVFAGQRGVKGNEVVVELLTLFVEGLRKACKSAAMPAAIKDTLKRYADTVRRARDSSGEVVKIEFSPSLRFPQVSVGPMSVERVLALLWATVRYGAVVSATLYVHDLNGGASALPMARRLRIPNERVFGHVPVLPAWVTDPVTLYRPIFEGRARTAHPWSPGFYPDSDEGRAAYYRALRVPLSSAMESASGGMLVLCTSYEAIRELSAGVDETRLIVAKRGEPIAVALAVFQRKSLAGSRPVWLATGSAWTGMNIYAGMSELPPPEFDSVLTDLVIPRLPFGFSGSSTDIARRSRMSDSMEHVDRMLECSYKILQGIGRLVRVEHLRDRRLWVLDPRAFDTAYGGYIGAIWSRYAKVAMLDSDANIIARLGEPKRRRSFVRATPANSSPTS